MKIFITHNYKNIYGGEFIQWMDLNIIQPLKEKSELIISDDEPMTKHQLLNNKFDIIINTGYDPTFLAYIAKDRHVKVISIMYDMNSEQILNAFEESVQLSSIISNKAKLMLLSSAIISPSEYIKDFIDMIYMAYDKVIKMDKTYVIKYDYSWLNDNTQRYKRLFDFRYIVIPVTYNSLDSGFIMPDIISKLDENYPIKVILTTYRDVSKAITKEITENNLSDRVKILTDLTNEEKCSLYKYAEASFFLSIFNVHLDDVLMSLNNNCLTFLHENNEYYHSVFGEDIGYFSPGDNIDNVIHALVDMDKDTKESILDMQIDALNKLRTQKNDYKSIIGLINKITE